MIETERTYLRPLERKDLPQRAEWLNHPAVRETLLLRFPVSLAETEQWFERILQDATRQDFVICLKKTGELIGFVGWVNVDWVHRKAEPFLAIGRPDMWGQGIGTEVIHKLLDYGFNELGLNRQYVHILDFNVRSLNLFLHLGFKQEGVLEQDVIVHGEYHDRIILGMTREAFEAGRAAKQANSGVGVKPSQQPSKGENPKDLRQE